MNESVLHAFIIAELRRDERFISMLKGSGVRGMGDSDPSSHRLAEDWITDMELELGEPLRHSVKSQVHKFVSKRWRGLLKRFNNDHRAAKQTLNNLLDTKFNELRLGERHGY